ncbi:unnamed protein product, partial [Clonostachys rosea]
MGLPIGEDPVITLRKWALDCQEALEKIEHDCHELLVTRSMIPTSSVSRKRSCPFKSRPFNLASTRADFNYWIGITVAESTEPWSLDFKTEGSLRISKDILWHLETMLWGLQQVDKHPEKASADPTEEFLKIFRYNVEMAHVFVDELYDLGDKFREHSSVIEHCNRGREGIPMWDKHDR